MTPGLRRKQPERAMKTIGAAVLGLACQFAAAGDFTRSMLVERLDASSYRVTCNVVYRITGRHTYSVTLFGGGTSAAVTFPYGDQVGPTRPRAYFASANDEFEAILRKSTLTVTRTFVYNQPPGPGVATYCQGGASNDSTGAILPSLLMSDHLLP